MKRPLVMVSVIWGIGLFLGLGEVYMAAMVAIFFYFLFLQSDVQLSRKHLWVALILCLFSVLRVIYFDTNYEQEASLFEDGDTVIVQGTIKDVEQTENSTLYVINDWQTGSGIDGRFLIALYSDDLMTIGDRVAVKGRVNQITSQRNPGGFDALNYYRQKRTSIVLFGHMELVAHSNAYNMRKLFRELRSEHADRLHKLLPGEDGDLVAALLLGVDDVDMSTETLYRDAGLIHILAISGLHISILILMLYACVKKVLGLRFAALTAIVVGCAYCFYTGMHISTIRATLMVAVFLFGKVVERNYDKATCLALVGMIMLCINPYYVLNVGFLLSFGAVAGLFFVMPVLEKVLPQYDNIIVNMIRAMLSVQIVIVPILAYHFHEVPIYSLVANVLVLPLLPVILVFSVFGLMVSYLIWELGVVLISVVFWLLKYMTFIVKAVEQLPYKSVVIGEIHIVTLALYSLLVLFIVHGQKKWRIAVLSAIICIQIIVSGYYMNDGLTMTFLDVGQGDCAVINYKGEYYMIDGGGLRGIDDRPNTGKKVIAPFLKSKGIHKLDTIFISHGDYDHIYGIIELVSIVDVDRIVLPEHFLSGRSELCSQLIERLSTSTEVVYFKAGDKLTINEMTINCLGPADDMTYDSSNDASLILHLNYGAFDSLFLGDVSKEQERQLLQSDSILDSRFEVVKVAHHGSSSSTDENFYKALMPQLSIISVGANSYGHPMDSVMETLKSCSGIVMTTELSGAVTVKTNGDTIQYFTMME